jgi:hypothetical protein
VAGRALPRNPTPARCARRGPRGRGRVGLFGRRGECRDDNDWDGWHVYRPCRCGGDGHNRRVDGHEFGDDDHYRHCDDEAADHRDHFPNGGDDLDRRHVDFEHDGRDVADNLQPSGLARAPGR